MNAFEPPRLLSKDECARLAARVMASTTGGGETRVQITSDWRSDLRWARNRVTSATDRRTDIVTITRRVHKKSVRISTNQIDEDSLARAMRAAERDARHIRNPFAPSDRFEEPAADHEYAASPIWSDRTISADSAARAGLARIAIEPADRGGLVSAGDMIVAARATAFIDSLGRSLYAPRTVAHCSMTVRDAGGLGSGWAGASSTDWSAIDVGALAARAIDKCQRSRNPVLVEPGRYTLIMDPQAVASLASLIVGALDRGTAETGLGPFAERRGVSKLGQRVLDERITIDHDPMNPTLGVVPFADEYDDVEPFRSVVWIEHGVLTKLEYNRTYALAQRHENEGFPNSGAYRMTGGSTSTEEMIRSTKRGLLVTRFHGIRTLDLHSLLTIGNTRDGLWLIENGAITKAVTNLRFTESPLFAFNNIEQLGVPESVFASVDWTDDPQPALVPPMKVRDFSFTSVADAI